MDSGFPDICSDDVAASRDFYISLSSPPTARPLS